MDKWLSDGVRYVTKDDLIPMSPGIHRSPCKVIDPEKRTITPGGNDCENSMDKDSYIDTMRDIFKTQDFRQLKPHLLKLSYRTALAVDYALEKEIPFNPLSPHPLYDHLYSSITKIDGQHYGYNDTASDFIDVPVKVGRPTRGLLDPSKIRSATIKAVCLVDQIVFVKYHKPEAKNLYQLKTDFSNFREH